jgi:hypothetical protein
MGSNPNLINHLKIFLSPNPNFFTVLKYIYVIDFKNTFSSPKGLPVPELQRGIFWWFGVNGFSKMAITFHPLG